MRYDINQKYKLFLNELDNLVIRKNNILNDFILIEVKSSSAENKFSAIYNLVDNEDFYKNKLLSVNNYGFTSHLLFYKSDVDFVKILKKDLKNVSIKRVTRINNDLTTTILNLFLKATLKEKLQGKIFNTAYKYIIPVDYTKDCDNITTLIFNFSKDVIDGEDKYYLNYSVRNLRKFSTIYNEGLKDYESFKIANGDYDDVNNYYLESSSSLKNSYVLKGQDYNIRVKLPSYVVFYKNGDALFNDIHNTIMMRFMEAYFDMKKYFENYISFDFKSLENSQYERFNYSVKKDHGRIVNEKFHEILNKKMENEAFKINYNFDVDEGFKEDLVNAFDKFGFKISDDGRYLLNIVKDPEDSKEIDYYIEHDFKRPLKNFIYNKTYDTKYKSTPGNGFRKDVKSKLRAGLFSAIIEGELIDKKTDFLDYEDISFVLYKKDKEDSPGYIYRLDVDCGNLDYFYIDGDYMKYDDDLLYLKDMLDITYDNETSGNYSSNKVRDYKIDMYVIKGEFKNLDDLMILRTINLRPIIDPDSYKDIFIDENFNSGKKGYPDLKEGKSGFYMNFRREDIRDYQYSSLIDIKLIGDCYISGYKSQGLRDKYVRGFPSKKFDGDRDLLYKFIDELFFDFLSTGNRFNSMPLALRYITVLRNIVTNNRINVDE